MSACGEALPLPPAMPQLAQNGRRRLCDWVLARCGWHIRGRFPDVPQLVLIAAPHSSWWDGLWGMLFKVALGVELSFMGKRELFRGPLGWTLRRLGGKDMFRVVRAMSMSVEEFTDNWFESETLRGAVSALAIHGVTLGAMSAGTGYTLMHNWLNRGGLAHRPVPGGVGRITEALAAGLKARGGEVRTSAGVQQILVDRQRATGVRLATGEEISAGVVLSAADPRHTLLGLVGAAELPPEFAWQAQSIKLRGSVAKVHVETDGRHGLPAGTLVVAQTVKYLERAYDAAKYGEISAAPYLETTSNGAVVSIHFQFAPYTLRHASWDDAGAVVQQRAIDTLAQYAPAFKSSIKHVHTITPRDLEATYGLSEGDLNHGQLILDQMFFMRPLPGWSNHKTPIEGLYLCGSGVHGGGGISGSSGRNAARIAI